MSFIVTDSDNYDAIADAIRAKNGSATTYKPNQMASAITALPSGSGTDVSDTTALASDVKSGKIFHVANGTSTTGTLNFNWMGENPELIQQVYNLSTTLSDTGYNTWTPSTTASSIKATEECSYSPTLDLENYDYVLYWVSDCNVVYDSTWSASKATCLRECCLYSQAIMQRPATVDNATSGTFNYTASQEYQYHIYWCKYYSSASAISLAYTTYSPCYISAVTAATLSSTSSLTPTLTIKTPVLSARCSTTYFSTANAKKVDKTNSTVKMKGYLYRVKRGTTGTCQTWHVLDDVWQNSL